MANAYLNNAGIKTVGEISETSDANILDFSVAKLGWLPFFARRWGGHPDLHEAKK